MASQAHLLDELSAMLRAGIEDVRLLTTPIRVIVPSRSLREHLSARLIEHQGRALVGVVIQTLHTVVLSILERGREPDIRDNFPSIHQ